MTVAAMPLKQMLGNARLEQTKAAIVTTLGTLLPGVTVVTHPGKLDINDVLAKAIVVAPGIAVGWTRMRAPREASGTFGLPIEFAAYIVVEDWGDFDAKPPVSYPRDQVAHAIGAQLLRILADSESASWSLKGLYPPAAEPAPEMRPVVTMKTADQATAVYAVTWTQVLAEEGRGFFGFGGDPGARAVPDGMEFDIADGDIPTELLALLQGGEPVT